MENKVAKLKQSVEQMAEDIKRKEDDNLVLLNNLEQLKRDVETREEVKKSRDTARGASSDPGVVAMKRMKKVVMKRHLIDSSRANAEEIDMLRQELDAIRQKTFPSFVRAARQRAFVNPDERG